MMQGEDESMNTENQLQHLMPDRTDETLKSVLKRRRSPGSLKITQECATYLDPSAGESINSIAFTASRLETDDEFSNKIYRTGSGGRSWTG